MSKNSFELDGAGVRGLLQSQEVQDMCMEAGEQIASMASGMSGNEYRVEPYVHSKRATATVSPASAHAYYSELKNNWLLKASESVTI